LFENIFLILISVKVHRKTKATFFVNYWIEFFMMISGLISDLLNLLNGLDQFPFVEFRIYQIRDIKMKIKINLTNNILYSLVRLHRRHSLVKCLYASWYVQTVKLLKEMGWNFTKVFKNIIGCHYPRTVTLIWILIELLPFLKLGHSNSGSCFTIKHWE
jgi:hypothetical protein